MPKNSNDTKHTEVKNIKEDINSLKSNTIDLAKHAKEVSADKTEEFKEEASERFKVIAEQGKEKLKSLESQIKEKPLQSMAIAFVAGLVFDALLKRR